MNQAERLRESRSKHLLTSYEAAVKQLRVFREVLPVTTRKSESSEVSLKRKPSSSAPSRPN